MASRRATLLAAATGTLLACTAPAAAAPGDSAADRVMSASVLNRTAYTFPQVFRPTDLSPAWQQQGLLHLDTPEFPDSFFVTYHDVGDTSALIIQYDRTGAERKRSGKLPIVHASEIDYRARDTLFYVAGGGGTRPSKVHAVDFRATPPVIVRTYDFSTRLPNGASLAIDNTRDEMVILAGPPGGPWTVVFSDFDVGPTEQTSGDIQRTWTFADVGLPQGHAIGSTGEFLHLVGTGAGNSMIHVFDTTTGKPLYSIPAPVPGEPQGLAVDRNDQLYLGFTSPQRVHKAAPEFRSQPRMEYNLLADAGAEAGAGGTAFSPNVAAPGWTLASGAMTVTQYGSMATEPSATTPRSPDPGKNYFSGGVGPSGVLTQSVDVSGLASTIDAKTTTFRLSGWLGGWSSSADDMRLTVRFLDGSNTSLGSATIGPVTPADRGSTTTFLLRSTSGAVPPGTRTVKADLIATRVQGTNLNGYADELSFVLSDPTSLPVNGDVVALSPRSAPSLDLEVPASSTAGSTQLVLAAKGTGKNQRFLFTGISPGVWELVPQHAPWMRADYDGSGKNRFLQYPANGDANQRFTRAEVGGGYFLLKPTNDTTKCVTAAGTTVGAVVTVSACGSTDAQRWRAHR